MPDNPGRQDPILNPDLPPEIRAAALMFRDQQGRNPITRIYLEPENCPKCGDTLYLQTVRTGWFPYLHTDYTQKCPTCQEAYLHGLPLTRDAGLSLIIWDSNPLEALKHMTQQRTPTCPFDSNYMTPTKIFGDWINPELSTYQWKCHKCFLTHHETIDRTYPRSYNDPLTDRDKEIIQKKLRDLGYIE
jgi:hypothetical protein